MASMLRTTTDADRVLTVTLDLSDKSVNIITSAVLRELVELVASIQRERPRGVIFVSAKPRSFIAGADLLEARRMTRQQFDAFLATGQTLVAQMLRLRTPAVAVIGGDCLGAGLDVALACGFRVAADDRSIAIGFPEVRLGLIPAFGATFRLPRLIGLAPALNMMTTGQTVSPREALRLGIVDEIAPREGLLAAARRLVVWRAVRYPNLRADRSSSLSPQERNGILDQAEYEADLRSQGHYPAAGRLIVVVRTGYEHGAETALAAERKAAVELLESQTGQNLMRIFFLRQGARKAAADQAPAAPMPVQQAAVIGGSAIGAGLAHELIRAGVPTSVIDSNPQAVAQTIQSIRQLLQQECDSGRADKADIQRAQSLLTSSADLSDIDRSDFIVEAVDDEFDAKRATMQRIDDHAKATAVVATTTNTLSVTELGDVTAHPARVVGMRMLAPLPRSAVVEIGRAAATSAAACATAVALAWRLGKTPIVVEGSPGLLITRLFCPYASEAMRLADEGVPIATIDRAMLAWGMAFGPLSMLDQMGLDTAAKMMRALQQHFGPRVGLPRAVDSAITAGWLGRKAGRGFYVYDPPPRMSSAPPVNNELAVNLTRAAGPIPGDEDIQWRLVLMMINEAAHALEEHVTESTDTIDLASLMGLGVPPFRGGIICYADSVGTAAIVSRLSDLAARFGARFSPAPLLVELARHNRSMARR